MTTFVDENLGADFSIGNLDKFAFVELTDVTASSIAGGALVGVDATADAYGDATAAYTNATTRSLANKYVSIAIGQGTAMAFGDNPSANVDVYGVGDKVIQTTQTYNPTKNIKVASGFVVAIDYY
jgi:hypothetical protein